MNIFTKLSKKSAVAAAAVLSMAMPANTFAYGTGDIVISKVFYAGSTQAETTKNYAYGQYIEVFNQSSKPVDLAGLYIALIESESGATAYLAESNTIAIKQLFRVPTDKSHILAPNTGAVIARTAIDHTAAATVGHDLSNAAYEFGDPLGAVADNENVPNLEVVYTYLTSGKANDNVVNILQGGDASIALFNTSYAKSLDLTKLVYRNGKDMGVQYLVGNSYYMVDAVDILKATKNDDGTFTGKADRKRFGDSADKGFISISNLAGKNGETVYRKTAINKGDNRYVLFDTNNSTEDFAVSTTIQPLQYDENESGLTAATVTIPESGILPFYSETNFKGSKDMDIVYISGNKRNSELSYNTFRADTTIVTSGAYLLVGAPGEHTVNYTTAQRVISASGVDRWALDTDEKFVDGVYTTTYNNRRLYKLVNEKDNVHFVRDENYASNDYKSLALDTANGERFFIELTNDVCDAVAAANGATSKSDLATLKYKGITAEEVITGVKSVSNATAKQSQGAAIYDVYGRNVGTDASALQNGIYVKGGKTIIVR